MPRLSQVSIYFGLVLIIIGVDFTLASAQGKLSPNLTSSSSKITAEKEALSVMVKDTLLFKETYGAKASIHKIHQSTRCLFFTANDANVLAELNSDPNVLFVDTRRQPHVEGDFDLVNPAINRINQVRKAYPDLHGTGYNISIKEENFNEADIDLKGRTFKTSVTPSIISQHATVMTVLIGGAGNSSPITEGVVNQVRVTSSDFNNLMPDENVIFTNNNILIQNHSYGIGIENYYGNEAFAYDQQVSDNPALIHVFSSGNIGTAKPATGKYANLAFANLTGTFKQSKNVLVISAIDTSFQVNKLNSRGPAYDGRLKPELTAYGPGGTSEAAALVTGSATLIQEKYKLKNNHVPDMSLVKAILIASADDIGAKGIDFITGYGNINAYKALNVVDQNKLFQTTLSPHDQISFPINLGSGVSQLKIAVCWADPPAIVNSDIALTNDIDSWIENGSSIFQPWVLSSFPHPDSLTAPAQRKQDHLNNVEYITVDNPLPGTYTLVIKSGTLMNASQKVSVAYYVDNSPDFSWTFPVASDIVQGGIKNLLSWEARTDQPGDLFMQINSGEWQLVGDRLNLKTPYKWNTPDTLAKVRFKMTVNGVNFLSDEFITSPSLKLKTAFICGDRLGLYWNKVSNATRYEVLGLGDQYLELIQSTNDTLIVFDQPVPSHFAVLPKLNQTRGIRSGAIDYNVQGTFCYINFFIANRIDVSEIEIKLSLSSLYNIDYINISKTVDGIESVFKAFSPDELNYTFSDFISDGGFLTYQVKIVFKNGPPLLSDTIELIIESRGKVVVWPNPVTQNDYLHIISEGNATFRILSPLGEIIYEQKLTLFKDEIDIESLSTGLYFYQLLNGATILDTGRIIKL